MKIIHFAPFAPNACGMYEAARDMVVADHKAGHDVLMVDVGPMTLEGKHLEAKPGQKDFRGDVEIVTATPNAAIKADVLIYHTGVPDNWVAKTQAPIIFIIHGRPASCFAMEQLDKKVSYSLTAEIASWPRVKAMVTFWPYHEIFWRPLIPKEKMVVLPAPPVDEVRFSPKGPKYDFAGKIDKYNIVIADCWREDINTFELLNGAVLAARNMNNIRFHIFAMKNPTPPCWSFLFEELKRLDAMGVLWARRENMEEVYRSADLVLSPQRIATRSIAEPLSCEVPVISDIGCEFATFEARMWNPNEVASMIEKAINEIKNHPEKTRAKVIEAAQVFSLTKYSEHMNKIYERIV